MKLKQVCSLSADYGLNISADNYVDDGIPIIRTSDFDEAGSLRLDNIKFVSEQDAQNKLLRSGDVLFSRSGTVGRCMVYEGEAPCTFAAYLVRFRPKRDVALSKFIFYWSKSALFQHNMAVETIESTIGNFNGAKFAALDFPQISIGEQTEVVALLDNETARIDQLIDKKQSSLDLLKLQERSEISEATVRGLNASVSFKDSGVEWFGDVPAHWVVCKLARLVESRIDYRGRTPEKVDDGVFLVTARNIRNGNIDYNRAQEFTTVADWEALSRRGMPRIGDVVFTTEAPLGEVANVDRIDVAFAQRVMKFRGAPEVNNYYLKFLMMSNSFQHSLALYASGSTAKGIKGERLAHLYGLRPPLEEQEKIVRHIEARLAPIGVLREKVAKSIIRLREYRSAIITAGVTGQLDVRTWRKRDAGSRNLDVVVRKMMA